MGKKYIVMTLVQDGPIMGKYVRKVAEDIYMECT